jgi:hypothetical protein
MFDSPSPPRLRFRIDPWASDYGASLQLEEEEPAEADVDPFVETEDWRPIDPRPLPPPGSVVFVDGRQRVEARVISESDEGLVYGAFVSLAVGAAVAGKRPPEVQAIEVHRTLAVAGEAGAAGAEDVACGGLQLSFDPYFSSKAGYLGVADAVDSRRRELEMRLGARMVDAGYPLVVLDGRLRIFPAPETAVVGFTKTLHKRYLRLPQAEVLSRLRPGQRSPLFAINEQVPLYSWYLRLAERRLIEHALAGLVRLETVASIGLESALALADLTSAYLPKFSSSRERDPRAPQNLLPIGALEARLGHEMGDAQLIRRALEEHLHRQESAP